MGSYIIKCTNLSSEVGTVVADVGFKYSDNLNDINEAEIKISGSGSVKRGLMEIGTEVEISRNGTLEFYGIIDNIDYLEAGTVIFHASGYEIWLAKENGSYASSPWKSTASATIFAAIIAESNYLTVGTINAGFATDFRLSLSQSLWNGITNLAKKTQQDVQVDYPNKEIDILDHRGSNTSVATFNEHININNVRVNYGYPLGNHILVFGKGDGDNQITGSAQDATSIAAYGRIKRSVIDRSVISTAEANKLADAELALTKDLPKIVDFDLINPNESISTGDIITLNALDLSNSEVRIVGIERGMKGTKEYTTCQVTNPSFKQLIRRRNKILARLTKDQVDQGSYMEGSTVINTWGAGINAKTNYPLKIGFYVPAGFKDEADNLRINSIVCDFDIDPFNQQFGTASFTGSDPQVQNTSGARDADVTGTSGSTEPTVTGNCGNTTPTSTAGVSVWHTIQQIAIRAPGYVEQNIIGSPSLETTRIMVLVTNSTGGAVTVDLRSEFPSGTVVPEGNQNLNNNTTRRYPTGNSSASNSSGWFYAWDDNYAASRWTGTLENIYSHSHGEHLHDDGSYKATNHSHTDNTYAAASHDHPDGSYDVNAADINHISVGDGVGEAGSVNATGATIYLDHHENKAITNNETAGAGVVIEMADTGTITVGDIVYFDGRISGNAEWIAVTAVSEDVSITCSITSNKSAGDYVTWVQKHNVVVSETIDEEIDISNSAEYPDVYGHWRIRVDSNSASADFIQAIVRLKFHIDS